MSMEKLRCIKGDLECRIQSVCMTVTTRQSGLNRYLQPASSTASARKNCVHTQSLACYKYCESWSRICSVWRRWRGEYQLESSLDGKIRLVGVFLGQADTVQRCRRSYPPLICRQPGEPRTRPDPSPTSRVAQWLQNRCHRIMRFWRNDRRVSCRFWL